MPLKSATGATFLETLQEWLRSQTEILVLIRYSRAAGNQSFEFFTSFALVEERVRQLAPETNSIVFRKPQLTIRGIVDDEFIGSCLHSIADGTEFLVVETARTTAGRASWFHDEAGESHNELREALEDSRRSHVAVGEYPNWLEDGPDVISCYIPDRDGILRSGAY